MRLIANCQLAGDYGAVVTDQEFECSEETGNHLLQQGSARLARPVSIRYETKVITPEHSEVKPSSAQPFRDVPDPHTQSPALAALRDAVREVSEVSPQGTADS